MFSLFNLKDSQKCLVKVFILLYQQFAGILKHHFVSSTHVSLAHL